MNNLDRLHTTELGTQRIKKNLSLDVTDVVQWCAHQIKRSKAHIERKGKNWYVSVENCCMTINAHSYTIITAHTRREKGV